MIVLGLALVGVGGFVLLWYRFAQAVIPPDDILDTGGIGRMPETLTGTFLSDDEVATIFQTGESLGIDSRLLAAIRKAEMGGPGREFGILSVPAPTYYQQASAAAVTIRNNVTRYEQETGLSARVNDRYTDEFIRYLGSKYAPIGVANDPTNLNRNWVSNVTTWYGRIGYA